jgi:hypothetical protein
MQLAKQRLSRLSVSAMARTDRALDDLGYRLTISIGAHS